MKKNFISLIVLCASFLLCGLFACGSDDGTIAFRNKSIEMELYDVYAAEFTYTGEKDLTWTVQDDSVVNIVDGSIVALSAGETTVSVGDGDVSDSINVKVNGFKTELASIQVDSYIELFCGKSINLSPVFVYNGKTISDMGYTYESSDSGIAKVVNGTISAERLGSTEISILSEKFNNYGTIVNVQVVPNGKINLNASQATVYAVSSVGNQEFNNSVTLRANVYDLGVLKQNADVAWESSDTDVCVVNNGVITGKSVGSSEIVAEYIGSDGLSARAYATITVIPAVINNTNYNADIVKSGTFTVDKAEVFGSDADSVNVKSVSITDGTFSCNVGIAGNVLNDFSQVYFCGESTLAFNTGNVLYKVPAYVWTDIINSVSELQQLSSATKEHYKLGCDLDMTDENWNLDGNAVFKGVFDGNNHTITGFNATVGGLFYALGNGASVKNIRFENALINSSADSVGVIACSVVSDAAAAISNIKGDIINNGAYSGGFIGLIYKNSKTTISDCSVHVYSATTIQSRGAIVGVADGIVAVSSDIYTNIDLCGKVANSAKGVNNSYAQTLNQVSVIRPTVLGSTLNLFDVVLGDGKNIDLPSTIEGTINKITLYSQSILSLAKSGGHITISNNAAEGFIGDYFDLFVFTNANRTYYYKINVEYGELSLNDSNKELLKDAELLQYAIGGTIVLTEDLNLSGITWDTDVNFTGTLDGNYHTISGLSTAVSGGLFKTVAGTVKNVAFTDVVLRQNAGVLGGDVTASLTVENVFVSASGSSYGQIGLVGRAVYGGNITAARIALKDVVLVMASGTNRYIYGFQIKAHITHTNVYSIGLNSTQPLALHDQAETKTMTNCQNFTDVSSFNAAVAAPDSTVILTDFLTDCVNDILNA